MPDNNLKHSGLIKESSIYLSVTVVSTAISFITLPIYTRFLSPSDFGIIALFLTFGLISTGLVSIGIRSATYRYYFTFKDNTKEFISLNSTNIIFLVFIFILSGILLYFISEFASKYLFDGKLSKQIIMLSFLIGCLGYMYEYFTLLLTAQKKAKIFAIITFMVVILNTGLSLFFIFVYSLTYMAKIYAYLITRSILLITLIFIFRRYINFEFSINKLKRSIKFSFPLIPRKIIGLTYKTFDKLMLNNYSGLSSVGYYTFGVKFAVLIKYIMDSIARAWNPFFFEKAHENTEEAKNEIVFIFFRMSFLIMFIGLGIIYYSEEMIRLLTTSEFYPAMYVVPIYVYYYLFDIISMLAGNQIMHAEKLSFLIPASIVSILVNIALNIVLIPKYGFMGACIATVIAALLSVLVTFYYGNKFYPLPIKNIKIFNLYVLILIFTIPIYPIMLSNIHFLIKIMIKGVLLLLFIIIGVRSGYIDSRFLINSIKSFKLNVDLRTK